MAFREQITIKKAGSYSKSSSGQISAGSTTTVGTFYAEVVKGESQIDKRSNQGVTISQNRHNDIYTFRVRMPDTTITKEHYITWNSEDYELIYLSSQGEGHMFLDMIAASNE